jgi:lambda repressor-like predicted transcriptional regulator
MSDARIFALRRKGNTLQEIADAVGMSSATVRMRLLRSGKFPGRVPLKDQFPPEKARVIFAMYKKGYSLRKIGDAVGYSYETVRTVLRKSGKAFVRSRLRCVIRGCKEEPFAKGYCKTHWGRSKTGRMDERGNLIPLQKLCSKCGREFFSPPEPNSAKQCMWCRWRPSKKNSRR